MADQLRRVALVGVAFLLACDVTHVCTLVGCSGGVAIHLASLPTTPFRVEAKPIGSSDTTRVFDCTVAGTICGQDLRFNASGVAWMPGQLEITVRVGTTSKVTQTGAIDYVPVYPNGKNCGAACHVATVTAQVP